MHPQLPLPFKLRESFNFDSFTAGENQFIVESLQSNNEAFIYLWGTPGSGKSHLLQSICQLQTQLGKTTCYLPLNELHSTSPELLEGLGTVDLICIDDIECIVGRPGWEEALFHLFNQAQQTQARLIVSSNTGPQQINIELNDLKSRLNSGLGLNLKTLSDESTISALQTRAQMLGLELSNDTANYMMTRFPRDLPNLWRLLDKLDAASLSEQRKLTIPFLKKALLNSH